MNATKHLPGKIGFVSGTILLGILTGCVGYVDEPHHHVRGYAPPPAVYVEEGIQDDYVYYPSYQVYYSNTRHNYIYLEGRTWVTRPAPPRVSVGVLFASPSVRLEFHDSPARHHSQVVRQYPKHWAPPGRERENQGHSRGNPGNGRGSQGNERGKAGGGRR
jgi:hypothetical protein